MRGGNNVWYMVWWRAGGDGTTGSGGVMQVSCKQFSQ